MHSRIRRLVAPRATKTEKGRRAMKQLAIVLTTLGLIGMTMSPVLAGPASSSDTRGTPHSSSKTSPMGFEAQHTMTGTVTSIDRKTGMMGLKTDAGTLMLHFPPSKIQNIKDGERVSVELGVKPETMPFASPSGKK
jgi:hypothetical protein